MEYYKGCIVISNEAINDIAKKWISKCDDDKFRLCLLNQKNRDDVIII